MTLISTLFHPTDDRRPRHVQHVLPADLHRLHVRQRLLRRRHLHQRPLLSRLRRAQRLRISGDAAHAVRAHRAQVSGKVTYFKLIHIIHAMNVSY